MNYFIILFGFFFSCTLYAPVKLLGSFQLIRAIVSFGNNVPDVVYSENAYLSISDGNKFKISDNDNNQQIFSLWGFKTMIKEYVEFDLCSKTRIYCLFHNFEDAQKILEDLKTIDKSNIKAQDYFKLSIVDLVGRENREIYSPPNEFSILKSKIVMQIDRFILFSENNSPKMIFYSNDFNVSEVLPTNCLILTVQIQDILGENIIIMVKFQLSFGPVSEAQRFYEFVKQGHHTNNQIPVDIPDSSLT